MIDKKIYIPIIIVVIILIPTLIFIFGRSGDNLEKDIQSRKCTTKAAPDPLTDDITWTLPDCASPVRLALPYPIDSIFYNEETGVTGYGVSAGEHVEGLNHEWINIKPGENIKSWADGKVISVAISGDIASNEIQVLIDYGHKLLGAHMELREAFVKKGDYVKKGQDIGIGFKSGNKAESAEFTLIDEGRNDGAIDFGRCCTGSVYDYLNDEDKATLVNAYKENILNPYSQGKTRNQRFFPYQPYLTNNLFIHKGNEGKITGQWYLSGDYRSVLTFIEADNPYFKGNVVLSRENGDIRSEFFSNATGSFDIDYLNKRVTIHKDNGEQRPDTTIYGIFNIDESGSRPTLKIEFSTESYPKEFTSKSLNYILRDNGISKYMEEKKL